MGGTLRTAPVKASVLAVGAVLALAGSALAPAGPTAGIPPEADRRLETPIVLVGLDGVDWQILDPLIAAGRTPVMADLKRRSVWGHLRSFEPMLSPLLWTTAATGKSPDEHGIIDFLIPDHATGRRVPITSRERRVRALWNIFSERGYSADVIAWWASWPAEPITGRMVSDRVAYSLFDVDTPSKRGEGLTYPDELWEKIRSEVVLDTEVGYERIARFLDITRDEFDAARRRAAANPEEAYREPINHLTKILATTDTYHRIALSMLRDKQPDLFAVYYEAVDMVCHRFAHFMPPKMEWVTEADFRRFQRAVEELYVYQDKLLGELLANISPESVVIVVSDHGFLNGSSRPADGGADIEGKPGKWHRKYGVIMIAGNDIPAGQLDTATLYDVTPTILALARLPLADDMKGSPLLRPARQDRPPLRIASYEPATGPDTQGSERGEAVPEGEKAASATTLVDEQLLRNLMALGYVGDASTGGESADSEASKTPETLTAHTNLASVLLQKGDLAGAESELRKALAREPGYVPALMTLSQVLVRQGRAEEAFEAARFAVNRSASVEHMSYVQLALLAVRAGKSEETVELLKRLRDRRPKAAGIHTALGTLALHDEAADEAERYFRAALSLEPTSPEAMGQLFQMYRDDGRETELEGMLREALRLNDRAVLQHNWLGLILARRGDAAGAEAEYRRALELAPDFGGTMANLGSLYGRLGRLEEAVSVLSRAVKIEPRNLEAQVNLGAAFGKLGRLDAAIASLEEALRLGLRSPNLLNAVGLAYAQKGEIGRAIEALEESLTLAPDQPEVRSLLAELDGPT
jgi:predicted AlkP superfamily phosphohydrolase/phosphomutase/tetratricopeptide (TPR) repeat protein